MNTARMDHGHRRDAAFDRVRIVHANYTRGLASREEYESEVDAFTAEFGAAPASEDLAAFFRETTPRIVAAAPSLFELGAELYDAAREQRSSVLPCAEEDSDGRA